MTEKSWIDPFADNIIERIDPKVRASLTPNQLSAIVTAIRDPNTKKYPIDVRGVLPLFFARYFFVFLVGRDQRALRGRTEELRRHHASWIGVILFALFISVPFLLVLLLFLYLLKLIWGWDIFPAFHIWEIFV
jgi:hypothetical protein